MVPVATVFHGRTISPALSRTARRLSEDRSGASAVEFSIVAIPFLFLICTFLEAGILLFEQSILQQAVDNAGRQIYTGSFQTNNAGTTDTATLLKNFRTAVCYSGGERRITIFTCDNVRLSVRRVAKFSDATPVAATAPNPRTGASDWNPGFSSYTCPRANEVVIVQAAVDVPILFPMLGSVYASLPNNRRLLEAASVFQVEPFDSGAACPSNS